MPASANGLRRLDDAVIGWTETAPLKGHAVRRHVVLALLFAAPTLAWDFGVGAPGDASNVALGLIYLVPVLVWQRPPTYGTVTGLLAAATTLFVAVCVMYGFGLLLVPVTIGTWFAFARLPTRW